MPTIWLNCERFPSLVRSFKFYGLQTPNAAAAPEWIGPRDRLTGARNLLNLPQRQGWVSEWFKEPVLKTGVRETVPWVRIPPHPPLL